MNRFRIGFVVGFGESRIHKNGRIRSNPRTICVARQALFSVVLVRTVNVERACLEKKQNVAQERFCGGRRKKKFGRVSTTLRSEENGPKFGSKKCFAALPKLVHSSRFISLFKTWSPLTVRSSC